MANDEYDKVELPALNQLQSLGWVYVEGSALSPEESEERKSFKDVVLEKRLTQVPSNKSILGSMMKTFARLFVISP